MTVFSDACFTPHMTHLSIHGLGFYRVNYERQCWYYLKSQFGRDVIFTQRQLLDEIGRRCNHASRLILLSLAGFLTTGEILLLVS